MDHHCMHLTYKCLSAGAQMRVGGSGAASAGGRKMNIINEKDS